MFSIDEIHKRIKAGEKYHLTVDHFLGNYSFLELHAKWEKLDNIEKHAAINPNLYEEIILSEVLGSRAFSSGIIQKTSKCMAEFVWGYPCKFEGRGLQADHLFPYSLGGPTLSDNLLVLCDRHNQAKSHDIHLYSWDEPNWLRELANRIAKILNSKN
jgi:hypothetical protein